MAYIYWIHLEGQHIKTEGYVGVTRHIRKRWNSHKASPNNKSATCIHLKNAVAKYGSELIYEVIFEGPEEGCYQLEEYFRPTVGIGWNIVSGGVSPITSDKQKESARAANLGRIRTYEEKQKVSTARKGIYTRGKNGTAKKVECLNTGQVFDCAIDASEWCGLKTSASICKFCREGDMEYAGKHPDTKEKLVWRYIQKYNLQIS